MDGQSFVSDQVCPSAAGVSNDTNTINALQTLNEENLLISVTEGQNNLLSSPAEGVVEGLPRPVKHRPTFTEDQITSMEKVFSQRQYLSPMEREGLASSVGLSPQQVRVWFQNRRQKVKQFLTQRQIRNIQNGQKQGTSDGVLTAQQLSTNIDPILQMLFPKVNVNTGDEPSEIKEEGEEKGVSENKNEEVNEESLVNTSSVSLSPSQVSLTPYILPLSGATPTIQLGTQGGANITIPAIQLLQSILSSSLPLGKLNTKNISPIKAQIGSGSVPLKALSPTPIEDIDEGTEIKSEELLASSTTSIPPPEGAPSLLSANNTDITAPIINQATATNNESIDESATESTSMKEPTSVETSQMESSSKLEGEGGGEEGGELHVQTDTNPVMTTVSSEILQQLLSLTGGADGLKTTWNLSVSSSPGASGSVGGGVVNTPTGITIDVPRRKRQVFSGVQTTELEKYFENCSYIDSKERDKLAEKIGLHPDQIKVWFQNRRTKKSRQAWRQQKNVLEQ